jgi:hypothetical protein
MDAKYLDDVARKIGKNVGRRRLLAALVAGAGAATIGWLRPPSAAARPYCGNCDDICDLCLDGYRRACGPCGACARGWSYECPGPEPCDEVP